jgi:hypothetical protein
VSEIMTSSKGAGTRWAAWKRGHLGPWANVITLLLKWSWFLHAENDGDRKMWADQWIKTELLMSSTIWFYFQQLSLHLYK